MKKVMAKIRKPVSLVLVVALIISMSAFVFGFTNNNRAALVGHYGFVSASATAIMDEEIIIQIPEETQDSGGYEEEYIPKSAYTEEYEAYASGDAYDSEDYYASSLEAYEAYASEDTYSSEDYYAPSFEEYEADAFEDAYGSEDYYAPSSDEYEADAFEDAYGSEDYYAPSLEEYEPDAFEDAYDDAGETHDPEYCDVYGCEYCIVSDGQIATAAATVNGITQDGAGTSEESDAPAQSAASTAATPNGVVQGGESGQPAPPADTFATNFSDLRNFVSNVTVLDLNGVPLEPVPPEDISNPFDQTYRFVIEFSEYLSEYYTLQFEQNELTGRLYYMLPSGLEMPAPVAQTPIRAEPVEEDELGLIIGWYTISADGLVEVWFESITIEGSEIPYEMSFIEFYTDIVLEITIDAILLEESGGIIDFGNYWVLEVPPVYYDFGIMSTLEGITPFASANDWDLSNFVTSVNIFDMTDIEDPLGTPDNPNPIGPGDSTFLGTTYRFDITFREDSSRQFDVDVLGNMTFRLPQTIEVKAAISNLDIRYGLDNRGAIIGRYSVTPGGGESNLPAMVIVTWYEVDNNGNPTPGTLWINNYTNCQFVLSIFAHLLPGSGGGNLDFGDGGITIEEPVQPEPRLDIVKKSAFNPETMTIDYTVFIQALRAPVLLYSWSDQLFVQIESQRPWPFPLGIPVNNPNVRPGIDNGFFSDFSYWLYLGGDLNPPEQIMEPSDEDEFGLFWGGTPATGSEVTYFDWFFEPIILDPETADYIRIEFTLDVNAMLEANNFFGMDHFQYDMIIVNYAAVIGMPPNADWDTEWLGAATTVADPIHKEFVFTKDGTFIGTPGPDGYPFINWNVQVGDGESIPLNGGWVVESLQDGLQLPPNTDITFKFYGIGSGNSQTPPPTPMFTLTAADLFITNPSPAPGNGSTFFELLSGQQFRLTIPPNTFIVPGTSEPLGDVYRLDISFSTNVTTGLPNPGMPPLNLRNEVDWFWPDGTGQPGPGATVPIRPPTAGLIEKTSGGICGPDAEGNYYIDYLITLKIPAGLAGAPLWIYDDLGVFPGGSGVNHLPTVTVTAFETGDATRAASARMLADPLRYTQPIQVNPNSWKMLFGTASPAGQVAWQYTFPVTVEISYRLVVPANRLQFLQTMPASGSPNYISNNVRLVNSANWNNPSAGIAEGQIVAINTQEWWPIFKSARETSNPALFNYTVTMLGRNKARPGTSFLNPDSAPIFRDAFDDRMMYVPDTFYVVRLSSPNAYFAPPTGTNILNASGDIEINLNNLVSWTAPPNQGGTQGAAVPGWFATTDKFEFHYDLLLLPEFQHSSIANLTNTATITRTLPTGCSFDATAVIPYNFNDLQKTMTPTRPGSDKVNVSIVINADGSRDFNDGVNIPGPNQIVAVDKLENLLLYVDSVKLYTQRLIILPNGTGMWDGVWTEVTHSLNDYKLWSVNAVATDEFAFVIPNRQPVLIEYQGLVTLLPGTTGSIKNTISIYGDSSSDGQGEYQVGDSEVGANANKIPVRVFKRDPLIPDQAVPPEASSNPGVLLPGARFELYAAVVSNPNNYTAPSGLTEAFPVVGTDLIVRNFYRLPDANIVHGADGITILNDPWLAPAHEIIFMLREVQAPPGYFLPTEPDNLTFFAINPRIFPSTHSFLPNPLNQISDFININNVVPISIEIVKIIETRTGTFPTQTITPGLPDGNIPTPMRFTVYGPTDRPFGTARTDEIPSIERVLTLPGADGWTQSPTGTFSLTIPDMQPGGNYHVYETGGFLFGWQRVGTNHTGLSGNIPPGTNPFTFRLTNSYQQPQGFMPPAGDSPTLWLAKEIHGLRPGPALDTVRDNLILRVESLDARFLQDITFDSRDAMGGSLDNLGYRIENLPPGHYTIREIGAELPGFILTTTPSLPINFSVTADGHILDGNGNPPPAVGGLQLPILQIVIENNYTPEPKGTMRIQKFLQGITPEVIPESFAIEIRNANGILVTRVPGAAALAGVTVADLPHGIYTVTEVGHDNIPNFTWLGSTPAMPATITIPDSSGEINITLNITNRYRPIVPPVPTPPGPWDPNEPPPLVPITPGVPPITPPRPGDPEVPGPYDPYDPYDPPKPSDPDEPEDPDVPTDPTGPLPGGPGSGGSPETGDTVRIGLYIALFALGLATVTTGVIRFFKKKQSKE